MSYRLLVCGGRDFNDRAALEWELNRWAIQHDDLEIIVGYDPDGANFQGADQLAFEWARRMRIPVFPFPAPWGKRGKSAGPVRNSRMLDWGKPHAVLAAPGGRGTDDMCSKAERAGIKPSYIHVEPTDAK